MQSSGSVFEWFKQAEHRHLLGDTCPHFARCSSFAPAFSYRSWFFADPFSRHHLRDLALFLCFLNSRSAAQLWPLTFLYRALNSVRQKKQQAGIVGLGRFIFWSFFWYGYSSRLPADRAWNILYIVGSYLSASATAGSLYTFLFFSRSSLRPRLGPWVMRPLKKTVDKGKFNPFLFPIRFLGHGDNRPTIRR